MPSEITPTVEQSNSRFTRLSAERNTGFRLVNTVQMMMRPAMTGNDPRSPERTRSTNAAIAPLIPVACLTRTSLRSSSVDGCGAVCPSGRGAPCVSLLMIVPLTKGCCVAGAWGGLGWGWVTPFDVFTLLWNLYSCWFIGTAPVRGGTHFLCCCKESKQRKQLPTANPCHAPLDRSPRSGPTGGVSLARFHRCWHVEEVRASHRYTKWTSCHSSSLALRARPLGKTETHCHVARSCLLHASIHRLATLSSGTRVPGRMHDC